METWTKTSGLVLTHTHMDLLIHPWTHVVGVRRRLPPSGGGIPGIRGAQFSVGSPQPSNTGIYSPERGFTVLVPGFDFDSGASMRCSTKALVPCCLVVRT